MFREYNKDQFYFQYCFIFLPLKKVFCFKLSKIFFSKFPFSGVRFSFCLFTTNLEMMYFHQLFKISKYNFRVECLMFFLHYIFSHDPFVFFWNQYLKRTGSWKTYILFSHEPGSRPVSAGLLGGCNSASEMAGKKIKLFVLSLCCCCFFSSHIEECSQVLQLSFWTCELCSDSFNIELAKLA